MPSTRFTSALFATTALLVSLVAAPAGAQGLVEALRVAAEIESTLFDSELRRYAEERLEERRAFEEWDQRVRALDDALRNRNISIEELRLLESRATLAREVALARSRQVTSLRERLVDRMDRLSEIQDQIDRRERSRLVPRSNLDGLWRLEVTPLEVSGLMRLDTNGTLVTGTYRLDGGSQGSVTGTFANDRLILERIDMRQGFDATLDGELDRSTGVVRGSWRSVDVTGGKIHSGNWVARKLTPEEERLVESGSEPQ